MHSFKAGIVQGVPLHFLPTLSRDEQELCVFSTAKEYLNILQQAARRFSLDVKIIVLSKVII